MAARTMYPLLFIYLPLIYFFNFFLPEFIDDKCDHGKLPSDCADELADLILSCWHMGDTLTSLIPKMWPFLSIFPI